MQANIRIFIINPSRRRYLGVKLHFYIIFILCFVTLVVRAQYDVSFSHYWAMEPSFNPAAVGKESKLNIAGAYAIQMAGYEHNPNTMYAAADMPFYALKSYHGVGLQFMNDAIGLFTHKRFALQYAYQPELWGGRLSVGVQLAMLSETFDGSKADGLHQIISQRLRFRLRSWTLLPSS